MQDNCRWRYDKKACRKNRAASTSCSINHDCLPFIAIVHIPGGERKHSKHENPPPFLPTNDNVDRAPVNTVSKVQNGPTGASGE
ncbi:hypothetical protein SH449x_002193 [Pirellulaceae bacterium SH449]